MVAEPSGPKVPFIDVSQWRGHIDVPKVKQAGYVGIWPRTTAGSSLDPYWRETATNALNAGLIVAARHRLYATPTVKAQFDLFAAEAERVRAGAQGLLISLDSEDDASWAQVTEFEDRAFDRWGTWLIGYYPCWWLPKVGNPRIRPEVTWWHSRYASQPGDLCGGRTTLAGQCWQYSDSGTVPGVQGPCDLNWFYGTRAELAAKAVGEGDGDDELTPNQNTWLKFLYDTATDACAGAPCDHETKLYRLTAYGTETKGEGRPNLAAALEALARIETKVEALTGGGGG
jgi:GH25 family lysozyme M1 (1,4-beta-N-acetylmuramidase)